MLVKNEDLYINVVLENICHFCDEIIVADHCSTDQTRARVEELQRCHSGIRYLTIDHPSHSHDLISGYAGQNNWIFAVDGDELYDPQGLARLRTRIVEGDYDQHWMILGNALNCVEMHPERGVARGYLAPPCRSMTKLYNFAMIHSWDGPCPERLHGGMVRFKEGYDSSLRLELYKEMSWEAADFRCLHLCFIRRSSQEKMRRGEKVNRKNISDMRAEGIVARFKSRCLHLLGIQGQSGWKQEKYMRGALLEKPTAPFVESIKKIRN